MMGTAHGSALGFAGGVAVTALAGSWPPAALAGLVAVVAAVSWWTTPAGAALTAAQCWGLYASFVVGHEGHLVPDWPALAVLTAAGAASLLPLRPHWSRESPTSRPRESNAQAR
ncbi:hypothetical protein [Saccharothrix longispora]|uniref:hypothetical protein n=1 Tax=Saccharothrix longispora TaxID=33920 RepID=UPI0028FD6B53|nr:hypothetical protein [Saccharothrix longispora]MBY8848610.1 hypothetical protein [Saccharothrix sp. MB29]MDU0291346.1 hypothetical protein [Saccharothrix longispora]